MSVSRILEVEAQVSAPDLLSIQQKPLPVLHDQIDLCDLQSNQKLLSDEEILHVENYMLEKPDGRYSKKFVNLHYGIIKLESEYYAVYKGIKHSKSIGEGTYGKVKLVQNLKTAQWYALKRMWKYAHHKQNYLNRFQRESLASLNASNLHTKFLRKIPNEYQILKLLNMTNFPVFSRRGLGEVELQDHLMMHLVRGTELHAVIKNQYEWLGNEKFFKRSVGARRLLNIAISMLEEALRFLDAGLLHRDIKLENMIYDSAEEKICFIDFGNTVKLEENNKTYVTIEIEGTADYLAPEFASMQRQNRLIYSEQTEIYSLGVAIAEIFGLSVKSFMSAEYTLSEPTIFSQDPGIVKYIRKMLSHSPQQRPTMAMALDFFKIMRDQLTNLPEIRVGMLYIEEYEKSDKQKFISELQDLDEVLLLTSNINIDDRRIIEIMRDFNIVRLTFINKIVCVADPEDFEKIPEVFKDSGIKTKFFFITTSNELSENNNIQKIYIGEQEEKLVPVPDSPTVILEEEKYQPLIEEKSLCFLPKQIDVNDLQTNKKLFSDAEIAAIKIQLARKSDGRHHKKDLKMRFGIIKADEQYYAIYKGKKHKKEIALGNYGKVKLAQNLDTGNWHALKLQQKKILEIFQPEYKMLLHLGLTRHKNFSHYSCTQKYVKTYQVIIDLAPGMDLFDLALICREKKRPLPTWLLLDIAVKILYEVRKLHEEKKTLHCDIKPENVMYDTHSGKLTVIDVGFAKLKDSSGNAYYKNECPQYTPGYGAPELFNLSKTTKIYNEKTEIYALGVTLQDLFGELREIKNVGRKTSFFPMSELAESTVCKDFIKVMRDADPNARQNIDEAIAFFEMMENNYKNRKIGFLNVDSFIQDQPLLPEHYVLLAEAEEIYFVTTNPNADISKIMEIGKDLEKQGIILRNKMFVLPNLAALCELSKFFEAENENKLQYQFSYFSNKKDSTAKDMQIVALLPPKPSFMFYPCSITTHSFFRKDDSEEEDVLQMTHPNTISKGIVA